MELTAEFKSKLSARQPDGELYTCLHPKLILIFATVGGDDQEAGAVNHSAAAPAQITQAAAAVQPPPQASNLIAGLLPPNLNGAPLHLPIPPPNGVGYGYQTQGPNGQAAASNIGLQNVQPTPQGQPSQLGMTTDQANQLASVIPPHVANDPVKLQAHIALLQQLVQLNVPPDQWMTVIEAMQGQGGGNPQQVAPPPAIPAPLPPPTLMQQSFNSPARNRSRSPVRRRDSPTYGEYQGKDGYRQRSPGRSATPSMQQDTIPLGEPKWTAHDESLPAGNMKVLSRTLFVGGTTCGEPELRHIFEPFGQVQTCIPNPEKRHAFVKYTNRAGAESARDAMQNVSDPNLQTLIRSVRWGVGFGPRDCNDYTTGVSIIPIERLTDADRKWVLTAPHGGSGGKPIEGGMVMEEPDIEIGAGVSSKAISRRVGGSETFRRGRGNNDRFSGRNNDRGYGNNRRSSPNRTQPNAIPQQGYDPNMTPTGMPTYGLPPAPAPAPFYGMQPGQGYYG